MKKLFSLLLISLIAPTVMASAVDWSVSFSDPDMDSTWGSATLYSYLTLATSTADALSPENFMANWSPNFVPDSDTTIAGDSLVLGTDGAYTGSVSGWEEGGRNGPWAGYLIVVLVNADGDVMYSFAGNATADGEGTLIARDDLSAWGSAQAVGFNENSNWTILGGEVDPNVPEPTALALLALGVAGVALRRRVA